MISRRSAFSAPRSLLVLTLAFAASQTLSASFLSGTTLVDPDATQLLTPTPNGTAAGSLLASLTTPFLFNTTAGTTSGTLRTAVFRNPSGTLDFYYQVLNDTTSATAIARLSTTSFTGWMTALGFRADGSSVPGGVFTDGSVLPESGDRNTSGSVPGFNFNPPPTSRVFAGDTSVVLIISTDATNYEPGNMSVIDGGTDTRAAFQPAAATGEIPEPATMALAGIGLLGIAVFRRVRR